MNPHQKGGVPAEARKREDWKYLSDGRWIERIVSTNNGTAYYPALTNRFVWDGKVLLAILDHTNGLVMSFMRGSDLSGSIEGAGGVGGVLAVKVGSAVPSGPLAGSTHFVSYDGNGNVVGLTDAETGENSAVYEYGPFGELLRATGPMAQIMHLRFSTMFADDVTRDVKYLFRDYRAVEGRWTSRDPIEERGGRNLFCFVRNSAIGKYDPFGEAEFVWDESEERDGGKPDSGGFTEWAPFSPEAEVYNTGGCCFHVRLSGGHARTFVLYNQGQRWGRNILEHERFHVTSHMKPAYTDYKSAAEALGASCMKKPRANCIRAAILGPLREEYLARSYRDATQFDWEDYGQNADPETRDDSWERMATWAARYAAAQVATKAAVAACPAGWQE